jgi:phosphoribosylaminoimidazolecarboxamide formyltransferase/IMP cyclohydrolase
LRESDRRISSTTRESLAAEAFAYTARYDTAIARWFQEKREDFPPLMVRAFEKVLELPYGENPHQRAAYYAQVGARTHVLSMVGQLGGRPLSFNNLLDLDAARLLMSEFQVPACVIVKHNNPCGVALATSALAAYQRAFACDPVSAYGGVICLNRRVGRELAEALVGQFVEVLFARGYDDDALEVLASKPNTRLLDDRERRTANMIDPNLRQVVGGMLVQDRDFDYRGHWRGSDEPGRLSSPGDREGALRPRGRGDGLGCVLSVRRRPTACPRSRGARDHPARRLGPRF